MDKMGLSKINGFNVILIMFFLLLVANVSAESTFFDNPDDAFIMGNSTTVAPTPGSGTSGEIIAGGCLTNWTCSDWSFCTTGVQIRNCAKTETDCYADLKKKPEESQNCFADKSGDKNNAGLGERMDSFSKGKIIILGMLIIIVMGIVVLFAYKRYRKNKIL